MARKKGRELKKTEPAVKIPAHWAVRSERVASMLGAKPRDCMRQKLSEIWDNIWIPPGASKKEAAARAARAVELYEELAPVDAAEGMLATQMVATHLAALECLRRAHIPGQTFEGCDANLKHAQKLMALYAKQLETLDKHRGKGQQKVRVEHVHIEAGAQAIVGNVEAGPGNRMTGTPEPLDETREVPTAPPRARKKARR